MTDLRDPAIRAARAILTDLSDRSGFDAAVNDIDDDVLREIVETWAGIIREAGAEAPWPPTALLAGHKYGRMVHVVIMVPAEDVEKLPHAQLRYVGRVAAGG